MDEDVLVGAWGGLVRKHDQPASAEFGFGAWLGAAVRPPARHGVDALCAAFRRVGTPRRHLVRDTRGRGLDPW